jgi:alpha-tubulin suppressor-like RCC1 family protein
VSGARWVLLALSVGCGRLTTSLTDAGGARADAPDAAVDASIGDLPVDPQLDPPPRLLSVGSGHVCVVRRGVVTCAGGIRAGAQGGEPDVRPREVRVPDSVVQISSYQNACCGRTRNLDVYCWGDGFLGLGAGPDDRAAEPTTPTLSHATFIDGMIGQCGVVGDNAWCWGNLPVADPRARATTPAESSLGRAAVTIAAGGRHLCAMGPDRSVRCRGANDHGQCGVPTSSEVAWESVPGLTGVVDVRAGADSTCALQSAGTMMCWGSNRYGTLGSGGGSDRFAPAAVQGLAGITQFDLTGPNACAVVRDGSVWCWGTRLMGQIGDGVRVTDDSEPGFVQALPVRVEGVSDVVEVTVGINLVCVRRSDESVWCWGLNAYFPLPWSPNTTSRATLVIR